ncbi:hypothetical protein ACH5RR_022891 [Cinchona calisaya]|uniref:Di19 C-terminal domain-containing protein n=1 Tax=Cinchona calisaya TaxID=153742 RepID=A0ABD2ZA66_9GENT
MISSAVFHVVLGRFQITTISSINQAHQGLIFYLSSLTADYIQRKRKSRKVGSHSTLSLLRRELREGNLQFLFGGSSCSVSSSGAAPDPLLSSFILPTTGDYGSPQSYSSAETAAFKKSTNVTVAERKAQRPPLSSKDQEEKTKRSQFVQGLLLSTILDDDL